MEYKDACNVEMIELTKISGINFKTKKYGMFLSTVLQVMHLMQHYCSYASVMCKLHINMLCRLSPAVVIVLLVWLYVVPRVADGPFSYQLRSSIDKQSSYCWSTMLFLQNFYPVKLRDSVSLLSL